MPITDVLHDVYSPWYDTYCSVLIQMPAMKCFGPFPEQLEPSVIAQSQQSLAVFIPFSEIRGVVFKLMFRARNRTLSNISIAIYCSVILDLGTRWRYSKCHVTSNKANSNLECAEDKFQTRGWIEGCEK
jgi:hypothetical protein